MLKKIVGFGNFNKNSRKINERKLSDNLAGSAKTRSVENINRPVLMKNEETVHKKNLELFKKHYQWKTQASLKLTLAPALAKTIAVQKLKRTRKSSEKNSKPENQANAQKQIIFAIPTVFAYEVTNELRTKKTKLRNAREQSKWQVIKKLHRIIAIKKRKLTKKKIKWTKWGVEKMSLLKTKKGASRYKALCAEVIDGKEQRQLRVAPLQALPKNFVAKNESAFASFYFLLQKKQKNKLMKRLDKDLAPRLQGRPIFPGNKEKIEFTASTWWKKKKLNTKTLNKLLYDKNAYELPKKTLGSKNGFNFYLNYFSLSYKLLYRRWHYKRTAEGYAIPRAWPTKQELLRREKLNEQRTFRRLAINDKLLKEKNLGNYQNVKGLEADLLKKENLNLKFIDKAFLELENLVGFPGTLGYKKIKRIDTRRVFCKQTKPSPLVHAFFLLAHKPKDFQHLAYKTVFDSNYGQKKQEQGRRSILRKNENVKIFKVKFKNSPFLAAGYRNASYDRAVRTFYKRVLKNPLKQVNFKQVLEMSKRTQHAFWFQSLRCFKSPQDLKTTLKKVRLLSKNKNYIYNTKKNMDFGAVKPVKDRVSLQASVNNLLQTKVYLGTSLKNVGRTSIVSMKTALNKRRNKRVFLDFVINTRARKSPAEQVAPPWVLYRVEKNQTKKKLLRYNKKNRFTREYSLVWGQRNFAILVPDSSKSLLMTRPPQFLKKTERSKTSNQTYSTKRKTNKLLKASMFQVKSFRMWPDKRLLQQHKINKRRTLHTAFFNSFCAKPVVMQQKRSGAKKSTKGGSTKLIKEKENRLSQASNAFITLIKGLIKKQLRALRKKNMQSRSTAIYWNIRLLFFNMSREAQTKATPRMQEKITGSIDELRALKKEENLKKRDVENMRYKFQPAKSTHKNFPLAATIQWLRTFFPKKHTLYTEDINENRAVLLSPAEIFRTTFSNKNPGAWKTRRLGTSEEAKLKQLINKSSGKEVPRFENMLTTSTKTYAWANRSLKPLIKTEKSFFKRFSSKSFTISSNYNLRASKLKFNLTGKYKNIAKKISKKSSALIEGYPCSDSRATLYRKKSLRNQFYMMRLFKRLGTKKQRKRANYGKQIIWKNNYSKNLNAISPVPTESNQYNYSNKKVDVNKRIVLYKTKINASWSKVTTTKYKQNISRGSFKLNTKTSTDYIKKKFFMDKVVSKNLKGGKLKKKVNIFLQKRTELWNNLTSQWTKKDRTLRYWLKITKRTLKRTEWESLPEKNFKEIRNRLKLLNWVENDGVFERKDLRTAFSMQAAERSKTPWLEPLVYKRALYSTSIGPYRKSAIPREQKRLKHLQYLRKQMFGARYKYIKGRRLFRLNILNTKMYLSLFDIVNKSAARRLFKNLNKNAEKEYGFFKNLIDLGNRYDVLLILFGIAPTIFWSKVLTKMPLIKVNGSSIAGSAARIKLGDVLSYDFDLIAYVTAVLQKPSKNYTDKTKFVLHVPANYFYCGRSQMAICVRYAGTPDIRKSCRLNMFSFNLFRSGLRLGR